MKCPCVDNPSTEQPDTPVVEGSAIELPRTLGLNIPQHLYLHVRSGWYTVAEVIPVGDIPVESELSLSTGSVDIPYYDDVVSVDVESFPEPTLMFPEGVRVEHPTDDEWNVYPSDNDNYHFNIKWVLVSEENGVLQSRFDVQLIGYDYPDIQATDIPVTVSSGDLQEDFHLILDVRKLAVSKDVVWLTKSNDFSDSVQIISNVSWTIK